MQTDHLNISRINDTNWYSGSMGCHMKLMLLREHNIL
jgi:hypothetical protein